MTTDGDRAPTRAGRTARGIAGVAALVVLADQITKALVVHAIPLGSHRTVIGGVVELVHTRNSGIAGGLLAGAGVIVPLVSIGAIAVLMGFALRAGGGRRLWLPLGLVLGGALGNLFDRLRSGAVTDFLQLVHGGPSNLADQAILLGVIGLIVLWARAEPAPRVA
jgi:signal peptidase II